MTRFQAIAALLAAAAVTSTAAMAENWTRFRGPNGTGIAPALGIPNQWSESDYAWQVKLPGTGHSSPVVWDGQLFVTSADAAKSELYLEAYDAATGERRWRKSISLTDYKMHASNSYASTTPAVDAERVYLSYYMPGEVTLAAFSHDGEQQWRTGLGEFDGPHGFAAVPVVVDDVVCLQGDTDSGGYLVALDTRTGSEKWRAQRPAGKEAYSIPVTMELGGGKRAIIATSTSGGVQAIDATSGEQLWQMADALPDRTVGSPTIVGDLVVAACGGGGSGKQLAAIRTTDGGAPEVAFMLTKNVPYVPTPIACGDLLFLWHDRGTVTCVELATGEPLWTHRVGGKYFGSPVCIGDRLVALSADGEAVVLAAEREFKVLGRTDLGESTEATPAVADGRLFLRTASKLMCLNE